VNRLVYYGEYPVLELLNGSCADSH
jgi:hypothetical protein